MENVIARAHDGRGRLISGIRGRIFSTGGRHVGNRHVLEALALSILLLAAQAMAAAAEPQTRPDSRAAGSAGSAGSQPDGARPVRLIVKATKYGAIPPGYIRAPMVFSGDDRHVGFISGPKGKDVVYFDGLPGPEYDEVAKDSLRIGPDSKRLAFIAFRDGPVMLVVDGKDGMATMGVRTPRFSPNSKRVPAPQHPSATIGAFWSTARWTSHMRQPMSAIQSSGRPANWPTS
jgi:hypothetical protein